MKTTPSMMESVRDLHDAELYAVLMDRDNHTLKLGFFLPNKSRLEISFEGIVTYRINDIGYQNVVSDIFISYKPAESDRWDVEKMARWTSSGTENKLLTTEANFKTILQKIDTGELVLVYVDPSWGAEIGVIASRVIVAPPRQNLGMA